jgi:serine/threonine protein kinase
MEILKTYVKNHVGHLGSMFNSLHPLQSNVLIDNNHNALIADLGHAILGDVTKGSYTGTGTRGSLAWMAPEREQGKSDQRRTEQMDMHAYGCLCYMVS